MLRPRVRCLHGQVKNNGSHYRDPVRCVGRVQTPHDRQLRHHRSREQEQVPPLSAPPLAAPVVNPAAQQLHMQWKRSLNQTGSRHAACKQWCCQADLEQRINCWHTMGEHVDAYNASRQSSYYKSWIMLLFRLLHVVETHKRPPTAATLTCDQPARPEPGAFRCGPCTAVAQCATLMWQAFFSASSHTEVFCLQPQGAAARHLDAVSRQASSCSGSRTASPSHRYGTLGTTKHIHAQQSGFVLL